MSIRAQLRQDAQQMHTFARLWHRLDHLNLDPRLLAQFAGPEYIPAMRELLRGGRSEIRHVNRLEHRIARDARGIARTATEDRYGKLIHHDLETLPRKLRHEFRRDLRGLDIHVNLIEADRKDGHRVRHHK